MQEQILTLVQGCKICSAKNIKTIEQAIDGLCDKCSILVIAYNRYKEANIPCSYWNINMDNFQGPEKLSKLYIDAIENFSNIYQKGISFCLAGSHGLGKTMVLTSLLKKACQKNYSCLYTTLGDIVSALIESPNDEKFLARKELMTVDFLVIDEFDPRFCNSLASADLFGKMLEQVFRTRTQNNLPTLMASNSPNPIETFAGPIKQSIDSLMSKVKIIPVIGKDFRKEIGSQEPNAN